MYNNKIRLKTSIYLGIIVSLISRTLSGQSALNSLSDKGSGPQTKLNTTWSVKNPFEHNVFIENKGQFTEEEKKAVGEPILF